MRFQKGRSGNPGGRPKGAGDMRDLARKHTGLALQTLIEIAVHGENESARVAAANAILDRGWGKPVVPIVHDDVPAIITFNIGGAGRQPQNKVDDSGMRILEGERLLMPTAPESE